MVFVQKQKGEAMAEYVNEDKPIIIKNETDSDFNVGVGIIFRKSGIYEISINDKTTIVTKVSERKTGRWIPCTKNGLPLSEMAYREGQKWYGYKCSNCNFIYKGNALTESPYCKKCGARMGEINESD